MTAASACGGCGAQPREGARFCDACGAALTSPAYQAEFKQVTVLFADVVRSMDLASTLGPERLREVMGEVFDRCSQMVQRYGGTVDKFTGDGVMAVFGAPVALEDHAFRACLAALDIQAQIRPFAERLHTNDGIDLALRIGLNSGRVIVGGVRAADAGYTAIGAHVGMAQRMESAAPAGGVLLSESTARLVENIVELSEPEPVHLKGVEDPIPGWQLRSAAGAPNRLGQEPTLVGRVWELNAVGALLDEAVSGSGALVSVTGPAGIGKSRLVREVTAIAATRGVQVYHASCESHTAELAFHAVTGLLRSVFGLDGLDDHDARSAVRAQLTDADAIDIALLEDLLDIRDPATVPPDVVPDARRRRLAALLNSAALSRTDPGVLVVEDVHWIDPVSEAMLVEFAAILPQTPIMLIATYRNEYQGALATHPSGQKVALAPLRVEQAADLLDNLIGTHPSATEVKTRIARRAAGNPFFTQELVRDLAERSTFSGRPGSYVVQDDSIEIGVPPTVQAAIAARIDRLNPVAKRTLNAAAVLGARFDAAVLRRLLDDVDLDTPISAELVDQVAYTPRAAYAFRHPLIRDVAYESQLAVDRAELHRRVARAIADDDTDSADRNAAEIADHLELAGDLVDAFDWHMRAGDWLATRDIEAARSSWRRARDVADSLAPEHENTVSMRMAARVPLVGTAWRVASPVAEAGYDELRKLAVESGDNTALAIAMFGQTAHLSMHYQFDAASRLGSELKALTRSIDDIDVIITATFVSMYGEYQSGRMDGLLNRAQRIIDLCAGDTDRGTRFTRSPLVPAITLRGIARSAMGIAGWREDLTETSRLAVGGEPAAVATALAYKHIFGLGGGLVIPDTAVVDETAGLLDVAERFGDDFALSTARLTHGFVLTFLDGSLRDEGYDLLEQACAAAAEDRFTTAAEPTAGHRRARRLLDTGDVAGALELARAKMEFGFAAGDMITLYPSTSIFVEALVLRCQDGDLEEAAVVIDRLAGISQGHTYQELPLLRMHALLADARGDRGRYRDLRDRYRNMATELGFQGHMAMAAALP